MEEDSKGENMVRLAGFEPTTLAFGGQRHTLSSFYWILMNNIYSLIYQQFTLCFVALIILHSG